MLLMQQTLIAQSSTRSDNFSGTISFEAVACDNGRTRNPFTDSDNATVRTIKRVC